MAVSRECASTESGEGERTRESSEREPWKQKRRRRETFHHTQLTRSLDGSRNRILGHPGMKPLEREEKDSACWIAGSGRPLAFQTRDTRPQPHPICGTSSTAKTGGCKPAGQPTGDVDAGDDDELHGDETGVAGDE